MEPIREIKSHGRLYAIKDNYLNNPQIDPGKALEGTTWYSDKIHPLQASKMLYNAGKEYKVHSHKLNKRITLQTQEALICMRGKAEVDIYIMYIKSKLPL